jgi:outer membrane lipoprotein-sorting protein
MKNLCSAIVLVCLIILSGPYSFAEKNESGSDASNPYVNEYPFDSVFVKYEGEAVYNYQSKDKQTYEWTETLYVKDNVMARETKGVTPGREVNNLQIVDEEFAYVINLTNKQGVKVDNASKYGKEEYAKLSAEEKAAFKKHLNEKGVVSLDLPPVGKKVGTEKILGYLCDVYETGAKPTEENIKLAVEKGEPLPELRKTWIWKDASLPLKMLVESGDIRMEFTAVEIKENTAIPQSTFEVPEGVNVIYNEYESGIAKADTLNQFLLYKAGSDELLRIKAGPPKKGISPEDLEVP